MGRRKNENKEGERRSLVINQRKLKDRKTDYKRRSLRRELSAVKTRLHGGAKLKRQWMGCAEDGI